MAHRGVLAVLELGSQYTDLIVNCYQDMGFSVECLPSDTSVDVLEQYDGMIISGGPKSVNEPGRYPTDPRLFSLSKPILGICYGNQLAGKEWGDQIHRNPEYGGKIVSVRQQELLFEGWDPNETVWMNHGDSLAGRGNYHMLAVSERGIPAAIQKGNHFGVQFHPEVSHTTKGRLLLRNFAEKVCGIVPDERTAPEFDADSFIAGAVEELSQQVDGSKVFVFASGGVDSSVAAKLAAMAGVRLQPVYLDMGNGRKNEAAAVREALGPVLGYDVQVIDCSDTFLERLHNIADPETRRKAFAGLYSDTAIRAFKVAGADIFIDGTIATDTRESGYEAGARARDRGTVDTIKSHHNPVAQQILEGHGTVVQPLRGLTKDRVRAVARKIGLPESIANREPFPGPGLYVRLDTATYPVPRDLAEQVIGLSADYGFHGVVLCRKGVGIKGDARAYEHVALLSGPRDWNAVTRASKHLTDTLPITRVLYHPEAQHHRRISQRAAETAIPYDMTREHLDELREDTEAVNTRMRQFRVRSSQTPVAAFGGPDGVIAVVRDVDSQDFRTCRPLRKPDEFPWQCYDALEADILKRRPKSIITLETTDKPPATTEWM